MIYDYPTFEALNTAPDYLYIPRYYHPDTPIPPAPLATDRSQAKIGGSPGPAGRSEYVGVQYKRGRWVAQWGGASQRVTGRQHVEQIDAAWERARALGLDAPEVRG